MASTTVQTTGWKRLLGALVLTWTLQAAAQTSERAWTERETRLANEYLSLLVQQP